MPRSPTRLLCELRPVHFGGEAEDRAARSPDSDSAADPRNDKGVTTCYTGRPGKAPKRDTLNLRVRTSDRSLIDRAAEATGKTRTNFILDATRRAAEEALMDQTQFILSPEAYAAFLARLDAPPAPNERLRRMLSTPAPWE